MDTVCEDNLILILSDEEFHYNKLMQVCHLWENTINYMVAIEIIDFSEYVPNDWFLYSHDFDNALDSFKIYSEYFLDFYADELDWDRIAATNLTPKTIVKFADRICWRRVFNDWNYYKKVDPNLIDALDSIKISWKKLSDVVPPEIARRYAERIDWLTFIYHNHDNTDIDLLSYAQEYIDWELLSEQSYLCKDIMIYFGKLLNWDKITIPNVSSLKNKNCHPIIVDPCILAKIYYIGD